MERVDVLHVEDDDSWAGLVERWLGRRNLKVRRLRSRRELHAYLSRGEAMPRCVLLDLTLGDARGLGLCDEIKSSAALQQFPVIILTGTDVSALECHQHKALYRLKKDESTEVELAAVLESVLFQQERSQGLVDVGDLRLDPHGGHVSCDGKPIASLTPGHFAGFLELVRSSPQPVPDEKLYTSFLARHPYSKEDREMTTRLIVRTYVSNVRSALGSLIGGRITRVGDEGYAYRPVKPLPRL
jgi:DNA-binding response OmpR family regulator